MPRKAEWFQRIGAILAHIRQAPVEILDRSAVEQLFEVQPRQATRILRRLGAGTVGGALLMSRADMLAALQALSQGEEVKFEQRRHNHLSHWLEQARREALGRKIHLPETTIPEGICLEPGKLEIRFEEPVDLHQKMMHLARFAAEDWHLFLEKTR
ncbi:MAG: hypothetical protein ABIR70_11825 [Bryobacteraceae bacterium]